MTISTQKESRWKTSSAKNDVKDYNKFATLKPRTALKRRPRAALPLFVLTSKNLTMLIMKNKNQLTPKKTRDVLLKN